MTERNGASDTLRGGWEPAPGVPGAPVICIIQIDGLSPVATRGNVVQSAGEFNSQGSGHALMLQRRMGDWCATAQPMIENQVCGELSGWDDRFGKEGNSTSAVGFVCSY